MYGRDRIDTGERFARSRADRNRRHCSRHMVAIDGHATLKMAFVIAMVWSSWRGNVCAWANPAVRAETHGAAGRRAAFPTHEHTKRELRGSGSALASDMHSLHLTLWESVLSACGVECDRGSAHSAALAKRENTQSAGSSSPFPFWTRHRSTARLDFPPHADRSHCYRKRTTHTYARPQH